MSYKLVPRSPLAIKLLGESHDWALDPSTLTSLGRAASSTLMIPSEWVQFSSSHLRLWAEQRPEGWVWHMQDSSTNGTWLTAPQASHGARPGKHRVPKGNRMVLEAGSIIQLSTAPSEVLEFEFVHEEVAEDDQSSATPSTDAAAEHHQHKRKGRDTGLTSSAKRPHIQQQQQQQQPPPASTTSPPAAAAAAAAQPPYNSVSPGPYVPTHLPHEHAGQHPAPHPSSALNKRAASVSGTPPPTTGNGLMAAHQHTMTAPPLGGAPMLQTGSNSDSLKEAKRLADRNQELRRTKEELTAQLEEAKQRAGDLSAQLEEARRLQAETEGKLADHQAMASAQIGALESKLEAEAKAHQQTESALAKAKAHTMEERAEAERLRNEVWQLRTDIGGLRNQVVVMEQQRAELEARAAADAAAHASLQADLDAARATTAAHTEALLASSRTISERERERNKATAELAVLHTQVEALKAQAADMASTERDLRLQLQVQEGTSQERLDLLSLRAMENASAKHKANCQIDDMVKALAALKHGVIASLSTEVGCADSAPSGAAGAPDAHAGAFTPTPHTNDTSGPHIPYTSVLPGMVTPAYQQQQQQPQGWPTAVSSAAPFHTPSLLGEHAPQPTPASLAAAVAAAGSARTMPGEGCGGSAGAAAHEQEQGPVGAGGSSSQGVCAPQHMHAGMEGMLVASEGAGGGLLPPGSGQHAQMPMQQMHAWRLQDGAQSGSPVCSREAMPPPLARMGAPPPASPVCSAQLGGSLEQPQAQQQWGSPSKWFQATQAMPGYGGTQHLALTPEKQHGRPQQQQQQQVLHQQDRCKSGTPAPECGEAAGAVREDEGMGEDEQAAQGQAAEQQAAQGAGMSAEDGAGGLEGRSKEVHPDQGDAHAGACEVDMQVGEEGDMQEEAEGVMWDEGDGNGRDAHGDAVMQGEHHAEQDATAVQLDGSVGVGAGNAEHSEGGSPAVKRGLDFEGKEVTKQFPAAQGEEQSHEGQEPPSVGATPQQQQQQQHKAASSLPTPSPLRSPGKHFRLSMSSVAKGTPTHGTPLEPEHAGQRMMPAEERQGLQQQHQQEQEQRQEKPLQRSCSPEAAGEQPQEGQLREGQPQEGEQAEGSGDEGLPVAWGIEGQGREASQLGMPLADISQEHQNVQLPRQAGTPSQDKGHIGLSGDLPSGSFPTA